MTDKNIGEILRENNFRFNKQFGQNFILDRNFLCAVAKDGEAENSVVLEIGAGAGSLTREIAKTAEKVIAFEIDKNLIPVLGVVLEDFNNITLLNTDIMKVSDEEIESLTDSKPFKIIANLPYYISAPVIMRFLESSLKVQSITVMVQLEVAERFTAGKCSSQYSAISVTSKLLSDCVLLRKVSRKMFKPEPNVDSAIIKFVKKDKVAGDIKELSAFIKSCFSMRRKTLENNLLKAGFEKEKIKAATESIKKAPPVRAEELEPSEFLRLYEILKK